MDKIDSVIERKVWNQKKSRFLSSLRAKTQLLKQLQYVIIEDAAIQSQKDGVEDNGGSFKGGAETFMLFLRGA
jgi:hypothetical protein